MESKKMKLPESGKEIEIKKYLTGGDYEDINSALLTDVEVNPKQPEATKLSGNALKKYNQAKIQAGVISLDGDSNDLLNRVRALPINDYQLVLEELEKLIPKAGK